MRGEQEVEIGWLLVAVGVVPLLLASVEMSQLHGPEVEGSCG